MIIKIQPDLERAKSLFETAIFTEESLKVLLEKFENEENQSTIAREYYEVIRELSTAILFMEGVKIIGESAHKETLDYLKNYKEFNEQEIYSLQDLRVRRNNSTYEGKQIKKPFIQSNKKLFDSIIIKMKKLLKERLK